MRKVIGVRGVAVALALVALGLSGATTGAAAPTGHQGYRDYNVPGAQMTKLIGINDHGVLFGKFWDASWDQHFFVTAGSDVSTFDVPGGYAPGPLFANAINDAGAVVGSYYDGNGVLHGFLRSPNGHFTYLNDPNAGTVPNEYQGTTPWAINDTGEVVGQYVDAAGNAYGFVYKGGTYTTIDVRGSTDVSVNGVNNFGILVGGYGDSSGVYHSFIDIYGYIIVFDAPGSGDVAGAGTSAMDISQDGAILDVATTSSGTSLGWLGNSLTWTPVKDPSADYGPYNGTSPTGIAEDGSAIVGQYYDSLGNMHSFILVR